MKINKKVIMVTVVMILVMATTISVTAATVHRQLTAQERRDITITLNGTPQTITDASGTTIYPVIINGSTYLPVRAVANLVNLPVEWDSKTLTVKLGNTEVGPKYLFDQQLKGTNRQMKINDPTLLTVNTDEGQQIFKNGISHSIWNNTMSSSSVTRMANFNVAGAKTITLTAYSPGRDAEVIISGSKTSDVVATFTIKKGSIVTRTFNLDGREEISFGINGTSFTNEVVDAYIFDAYIE